MYKSYCGIDFGTTNSAVSVLDENNIPKQIIFEKNKETIPTAIFFPEDNTYAPIFGSRAIEEYISGGLGRFMRSIKRILGTDLMNLKTEVNEIRISYDDIIGYYIRYLKNTAESQIGVELEKVVLGRPVHFQDYAPDADEKAESFLRHVAINAGFKEVCFQYEPIAAAYAHEQLLEKEKLTCVIDIGGGTSDFSVIRLGPNHKKQIDRQKDILANTGVRIGGNDFDRDLAIKCFMPNLGYGSLLKPNPYNGRILPVPFSPYAMLSEWSSINNLYTYKGKKNIEKIYEESAEPQKVGVLLEVVKKELGHTLLNNIENCKIALTNKDKVTSELNFLQNPINIEIEKRNFEESIKQDTHKVIAAMTECLQCAGVSYNDIELVILTGGSMEIPYIKNEICSLFLNANISEEGKFSSVSSGLGWNAEKVYK